MVKFGFYTRYDEKILGFKESVCNHIYIYEALIGCFIRNGSRMVLWAPFIVTDENDLTRKEVVELEGRG